MARTNLQVITDALRLVGVVNQLETPSNEDAQDALRRMNDMMLAFKRENGIDLGYYVQTSTSASIPVDDEYFEPITLLLAKKLAPHWGVSLSQDAQMEVARAWSALLAQFAYPEPASLSHVPGVGRNTYSIDTDTI